MAQNEREFHIWAAETASEREQKKAAQARFLKYLENSERIADLGCGDGVFLELVKERHPEKYILGVDSNPELVSACKDRDLNVKKTDVLTFMKTEGRKYDAFVMLDLLEHLDFGKNVDIFRSVPEGAILIIKTPNINSALGHQFYLQCPGHVAPYSPFTIGKMLERSGFEKIAEGEMDYCCGRIIEAAIRLISPGLRKIFGAYPSLALGGGNYFVVAVKI